MKITNPATLETLRTVQEDSASSITEKFARAKKAQPAWAKTPFSVRKQALQKFHQSLEAQRESLSQILTAEVGKPIAQARNELKGVLERIDFFVNNTERVTQVESVGNRVNPGMEERITHEPLGVVANISAWNYPYLVGANVLVPALLTGNAVLYKPSEYATLTGLEITRHLHEAGIPPDLFIPVIGGGEVGALLLQQPLQGAFFTGSYATGKKIAAALGPRLIKTQLELGGKDPVYVCEDVDPLKAAEATADGAFYNNGQSCCAVERIYVHAKIYDAFVEAFLKTVRTFVLGNPLDENTYLGPLTREAQLALLERQISDAQSKGAQLLCGGKRVTSRPGHYFEPTVLVGVNHFMEMMKEESFGPLIGIQKVSSDDEALALMNDTEYGLTAGVYTQDSERAGKILSECATGSVYWNCCDRVSPRLPWSGRGHSGMGATLSTYGILTFVQPKAWHLKR